MRQLRHFSVVAEYGVGAGAKATFSKGGRSLSVTQSFTVPSGVCP